MHIESLSREALKELADVSPRVAEAFRKYQVRKDWQGAFTLRGVLTHVRMHSPSKSKKRLISAHFFTCGRRVHRPREV